MAETASVFAPAKVNLYLHVTGRRDDGYHLLDSLMAFAGVGDTVTAAPANGLSLSVGGPFAAGVPTGADNLVLKAARALADLTGRAPGAALHLDKALPAASGIGGGSADAAAALKALIRLWGLDPDPATLHDLALDLGADVPVCLAGRASFVSGIGETLTPAPPLPRAGLVLVNPGVAVSTPAVFKARTGDYSAAAPFSETPQDVAGLARLLAARGNDLAAPAARLTTEIDAVLTALGSLDGVLLARMSGSGATCFGLFADPPTADAAAATLAAGHADWWVAAAPLLDRI